MKTGVYTMIGESTDTEEEPEKDRTDRFLANNPGNFIRQKAVNVDLSDFENVRRQLQECHQDQLA